MHQKLHDPEAQAHKDVRFVQYAIVTSEKVLFIVHKTQSQRKLQQLDGHMVCAQSKRAALYLSQSLYAFVSLYRMLATRCG
jgi:hypothetical protein